MKITFILFNAHFITIDVDVYFITKCRHVCLTKQWLLLLFCTPFLYHDTQYKRDTVCNSCEPSQWTWSVVPIRSNISLRLFRAFFSVKEVRIVSAHVKIKYEYDNFWKHRKISGCVRPKLYRERIPGKCFPSGFSPFYPYFIGIPGM